MNFPLLPDPDTHCFDEDTKTDCWSHSPEQLQEYAKQVREAAIEAAAKVCESEYDNWDNERPLRICATAIRSLK